MSEVIFLKINKKLIMNLDIKSTITLKLIPHYEGQELSSGTGFLYESEGKYFLVTNWHIVTGRDPNTLNPIHTEAGIPNNIWAFFKEKNNCLPISLYNDRENKSPCWFIHPKHGEKVDVVVIPLDDGFLPVLAVNNKKISRTPDMEIIVGQDVFVLGYPKGISGEKLFPIWKRATIATEPNIDIDDLPKMLIDTATREGMSGSPVFAKSRESYRDSDGKTHLGPDGDRFIGVYSGRIGISKNDEKKFEAQLGIVWKEESIKEIIAGKKTGVSSFSFWEN